MKQLYLLSLVSFLFFAGCSTQVTEYLYGPRWSDYNEWKNLKLVMTYNEVLQLLGEPYMTQAGYNSVSSKTEIITFKLRVKYYQLKRKSYKKDQMIPDDTPDKSSSSFQDFKPEKYYNYDVWGEMYTLVCEFNDELLTRWYCPELQLKYISISDTTVTA